MSILGREQTVEIQMHDTYYVFARWHLAILVALVFAILGGVHWFLRDFLMIDALNWFHAIVTIFAVILFLLMIIMPASQGRYTTEIAMKYNLLLYGFILLFCLAQFLFIGNVVAALVRGK